MKSFAEKIRRFIVSEDGPTAVEYAMMLTLILLAVLTVVTALGTNTSGSFDGSGQAIKEAMGSG